jgi:hypothetical protein
MQQANLEESMEPNWIDSYYEALQFFYWEPQHIGRKKHVSAEFDTIEKVIKHVRRMEVTLNHNLNQFFLLAPVSLRNDLFRQIFKREFILEFVMHGCDINREFQLVYSVQPDFLFTSDKELVSIEMKVGAKSSISQVLKYALLGLAVEMYAGQHKSHYLGFLGFGEFSKQWQEQFPSVAELKLAIANTDLSSFLGNQPSHFREHQARFSEIVASIEIESINYSQFAEFLRNTAPPNCDQSPGAEVYRNLISGLVEEFRRRHLTT